MTPATLLPLGKRNVFLIVIDCDTEFIYCREAHRNIIGDPDVICECGLREIKKNKEDLDPRGEIR